ncbi:MAG: hypothetical protein LBQ24_06185 [Candidatus Peribacteria bacterium]|nr:hypothetical protein [Candidatus Peribacteria bacterium]
MLVLTHLQVTSTSFTPETTASVVVKLVQAGLHQPLDDGVSGVTETDF